MKVDVSEIKTFKACKRQWQLSSRNRFHLAPIVAPPQFAFGTIFHEALAQMYLGVSLDKVMEMVRREMRDDGDAALLAMVPGYYKNVLPGDLDRFKVLDVEHHFEIAPTTSDGEYLFDMVQSKGPDGNYLYDNNGNPMYEPALTVVGSIDMIVLDIVENKIYGFEHKTCKSFRDESYLWMDEQPRVYTWALQQYVREYNEKQLEKWFRECDRIRNDYERTTHNAPVESFYPEKPPLATLGGVYLNEVKKLLRGFQYNRTLCTYTDEDLDNFMLAFFDTCTQCKHAVDNNSLMLPQPSYMGCSMCAYKTICTTYMYNNLNKDDILEEFKEEFKVREEDHLEEKVERTKE